MAKTGKLGDVDEKFNRALDVLIERIRGDRSILAAILCGSLSHDRVWEKSDIDLILVTVDEKLRDEGLALYADGINVHACLMTRSDFRKSAEGSLRGSFEHSLLAKGRLLYTHDPTITGMCERLEVIGDGDIALQLLAAGSCALPPLYKARKWLLTRGDLDYTALWILHTATPLAKIEVLSAKMLVDREVLPQAMKLNPAFFRIVYADLLNARKTRKAIEAALSAVENYLAERTGMLFGTVIQHLREVGEARSATEIEDHFLRNFGIAGVTGVCEYLSDRGLIEKVSLAARLTKRSNVDVEELAFFAGSKGAW